MGESFTIQISSNLIKQLADDGDKVKKRTKRPKNRVPPEAKAQEKQIPDEPKEKTPPVGWPVQPPLFLPVPQPLPPTAANREIEAIHSAIQESERVLERLKKQEELMSQEVTQKAKELHEKEFKLPNQKLPPCPAEKDACFDCYKENVKNPLKCADVVRNYADCVRKHRQQVSSAE
ncbi:hypothetical protein NMG60_11027262 [Bertholletia excelsa]